jgi:hypothetical protein
MPSQVEDPQPKGQAYGQKTVQQQFVQQTQAPKGGGPELPAEEPDPTHPVEGFGDLNDVLFAPTERPGEPLHAPAGQMLDAQQPTDPGPDFFKLSQDPTLSAEFRAMMRGGLLARFLG